MRPLEGYRVVELGTHVAAPAMTKLMADWGADVIKVEPPKGEAYRTVGISWKLPNTEENNPIFQPHNSNKRSLSLNLKNPEALEALMKLLETADVFVTNTRPGALKRLGLDYETVKVRCPKLVYAHCTAFGLTGPDKDGPGFDTASYWGRGGMLLEWTAAEYIPFRPHPGFGDGTVGSALLSAVLACLLRREKTGTGEYLTASLYGTALWYNFHGIVEAQYPGHDNPISRYAVSMPMAPVYRSKDGVPFFCIVQMELWNQKSPEFFTRLGLTDLAADPTFTVAAEARKNMKYVVETLEKRFTEVEYALIDETAKALNFVHADIRRPQDALTDPQAWENGYLKKINLENGDELVIPNTPVQFDSCDVAEFKLAPHLGADSREILKEIGYTDEQITAMAAVGAVNTHE